MAQKAEILAALDKAFVGRYTSLAKGQLKWPVERGHLERLLDNPKLKLHEVPIESIKTSLLDSASTRLSLSPTTAHAYLFPRDGGCRFIVGYRGFEHSALRDAGVTGIQTVVVREGDPFEVRTLNNERLVQHTELWPRDKRMVAVYCIATYANGYKHVEVMDEKAVMACRAAARDTRTWDGAFGEEMWKKSCVRRASKHWPVGPEFAEVLSVIDRNEPMRFDEPGLVTADQVDQARERLISLGLAAGEADTWLQKTAAAMGSPSFAKLPAERYDEAIARLVARHRQLMKAQDAKQTKETQ